VGFGVQPKGSKLLLPSVSRAGLQLSVSVPRLTNCARATAATQPRMANLETEAIVCCVRVFEGHPFAAIYWNQISKKE
jgi:hypothetical protein